MSNTIYVRTAENGYVIETTTIGSGPKYIANDATEAAAIVYRELTNGDEMPEGTLEPEDDDE